MIPECDFIAEEVATLEHEGIFGAPEASGDKRSVDISVVTPSISSMASTRSSSPFASSRNSTSPPLATTTSVNCRSLKSGSMMLPTSYSSPSALEFIGFNPETASQIFARWSTGPDPFENPYSLLDFAINHIREFIPIKDLEFQDPAAAMAEMGLTQEFRSAILDPSHSAVPSTESLWYWIKATLKMRDNSIIMLQNRLKETAARIRAQKNHELERRAGNSKFFEESAQSSVSATVRSKHEVLQIIVPDCSSAQAAVQGASPHLDNHQMLVLYKGVAACEAGHLIHADASINLLRLRTYPGGIFGFQYDVVSMTDDLETAEMHRQYAARRCRWSETWLVRIQIPTELCPA